MTSRLARALGIVAALASLTILVVWGGGFAKEDENRITVTKEIKTMALSQPQSTVPPIDAVQPAKFETATFALG